MSDSDDTDVLLLIPPDFFLVNSSDSEDSTGPEVRDRYSESYDIEKLVFNDLISQVNELKNRMCVIENKNSVDLPRNLWGTRYIHQIFDYETHLGSDNYHYLERKDLALTSQSMLSSRYRFGGSFDNLKTHQTINCGTNSLHSTPVKLKQAAVSLPSTPSVDTSVSSHPRQDGSSSSPRKSAITIEPMTPSEILSMSHPVTGHVSPSRRAITGGAIQYPNNSGKQKQPHQDSDLIGEIDQFLDSVKKVQPQMIGSNCSQKENAYNCGDHATSIPDQGCGLRDFSNLPVREEIVKSKCIVPLEKEGIRPVKQAKLTELDQLLRETENSDLNDGKHSNPKSLHKEPFQQKNLYTCGGNINSVPDLAFGLRSFNSLPVREEVMKRKTVLPLETNQIDTEIRGLELSDIEKLLKQMEATQHEIEKKLQLSRNLSEKDHVPGPQKTSFAGVAIGSVPDRGFGVRSILNSSKSVPAHDAITSANGTRAPVREETVTRRSISLLGTKATFDKTQLPQDCNSIEQRIDSQNIEPSGVETIEKTEGAQQVVSNHLAEQEKVAVARRRLELGGDASTIPNCGFGLKSWYQSSQPGYTSEKDGYSESLLHSSHNIPRYVHDDVAPSYSINGRSVMSSTSKDSYIQGDNLPSVPDLGFGLRNLWTNSAPSQGLEGNKTSYIPKLSHPSAQAHTQQMQRNNSLNAAEYSLLSQVEPYNTASEAGHSKTDRHWIGDLRNINTQSQSNSLDEGDRRTIVTDMAKKKVDFNVGSGQGDVAITQQEQGAERNIVEGLRTGPDYGSTFFDSGLAASVSSGTSNFLSLSDLWAKDGSSASQARDERTNIRVRLEEERYRRQHCERLIQQLQIRLLEEQQKLAVAVQVDKGKDEAILQLQDAWKRLVHHWKELEEQRHRLAGRLQSEREANQRQESETAQKQKRLEYEMSKTLDLAQGYKEKYDIVEKEKLELIEHHNVEIKEMIDRLQEGEQKLDKANQLNCQIIQQNEESLEKVKQAEEEAQKERKLLIDAQMELEKTHKKLNLLEAELSALKEEKDMLQLKLKEEKARISILNQQKKSLEAELDESKKNEKSVREEMEQLTVQSERMKAELREYYQEQLEVVVREKLREFQDQLDSAEKALYREMEQQQHAMTELASKKVKQLSQKHQLEVHLLGEKHKEEIQLYKLQLNQAMQKVSQLEAKLQGYDNRKSEIVENLQKAMQIHWQEALRIICGNSPLVNHGAEHTRLQPRVPQQSAGSSTTDEMPFGRDGLLTYRKVEHSVSSQQTPPNKGHLKTDEEDELKKYIMMLLDRSPGNPVDDLRSDTQGEKLRQDECSRDDKRREPVDVPTNEASQDLKWETIFQHDAQPSNAECQHQSIPSISGHGSARDGQHMKPPWK